jgi:hypothetical protein
MAIINQSLTQDLDLSWSGFYMENALNERGQSLYETAKVPGILFDPPLGIVPPGQTVVARLLVSPSAFREIVYKYGGGPVRVGGEWTWVPQTRYIIGRLSFGTGSSTEPMLLERTP